MQAAHDLAFDKDGRAFTLHRPASDTALPSFFAFGLVKAGSTLLSRLAQQFAQHLDLTVSEPFVDLHRQGLAMHKAPPETRRFFARTGYAFTGFRSFPHKQLPRWSYDRSVTLIRDPRDMLTSKYFSVAYSHSLPETETARETFTQTRAATQLAQIDDWVLDQAQYTLNHYRRVEKAVDRYGVRIWRYEDIIFDKMRWAEEMLSHLGYTIEKPALTRMVAACDLRPDVENPDKHVRKVTPGDHAEKLRPETIARLDDTFGPLLSRFGYR